MSEDASLGRIRLDRRPLGEMTVEYAISAGYDLSVHCATCRVIRPVDLLALAAAGREKQAIGLMKFRCHTCSGDGKPSVNGWENGRICYE